MYFNASSVVLPTEVGEDAVCVFSTEGKVMAYLRQTVVRGNNQPDTIFGGDGSDLLSGDGSDDYVSGGDSRDISIALGMAGWIGSTAGHRLTVCVPTGPT